MRRMIQGLYVKATTVFAYNSNRREALFLKHLLIFLLIVIIGIGIFANVYIYYVNISNHHTYYVSRNGNNTDGKSWMTAWNELSQIQWSVVQPGDTLLLDGGLRQMVYTTTLTVAKSGTSVAPITIRLASEAGRNGQVVIFGGRTIPLKYCNQEGYIWQTKGVLDEGIDLSDSSWIIVDGTKWRGIDIHGTNQNGIIFTRISSNDIVRNVEIYDNGIVSGSGTDNPGIELQGKNITVDRAIIHDNGQDGLQSPGVNHFILTNSWLYNGRENPLAPQGTAWNYPCTHQDGIQVYGGGVNTAGYTFQHDIFGPGLQQGILLAEDGPEHRAEIHNVTIEDSLFIDAASNAVMGSPPPTSDWTLNHITSYETPLNSYDQDHSSFYLDGSSFFVTNSIIYGGNIHLPTATKGTGNCQFNTSGNGSAIKGQVVDPRFATNVGAYSNTASLRQLMNTNFSLQATSPCLGKGSSITAIVQLIDVS